VLLKFLDQCRRSALDDVTRDVRVQHEPRHNGSRGCGGESERSSRKSSGTSVRRAKNDAQFGLTGVMSNPSPCLRILTSLTSVGKRNSCGSRTAWLAPFRNMDARRATAADICLAAVFDVTDLFFPVRVRFIWVPQIGLFRLSICFAYAKYNIRPLGVPNRRGVSNKPSRF
jgi:hypothetical protein